MIAQITCCKVQLYAKSYHTFIDSVEQSTSWWNRDTRYWQKKPCRCTGASCRGQGMQFSQCHPNNANLNPIDEDGIGRAISDQDGISTALQATANMQSVLVLVCPYTHVAPLPSVRMRTDARNKNAC